MSHPVRNVVGMGVQFFETLRGLGRSIGQGHVHRRRTTVFEMTRGHGSVLAQFRVKPGRWVVTIEADSYHCADCGRASSKYLQFMILENGVSVIGECVSSQFLDSHHEFTPEQEDTLRSIGWNEPVPNQDPNWFFEAEADVELITLTEMTRRTVREVMGLCDSDAVEVSFYEMAVGAPDFEQIQEKCA
jgi:hypothetical protein